MIVSRGNWEFERKANFDLKKRTITGTATVRTGRTADSGIIDVVIDIVDPEDNFTLTVPDGTYMGQQLLIVMSSNANSKTASVSFSHHETSDPEVLIHDAADEYTFVIWTGTEWATISNSSTTS